MLEKPVNPLWVRRQQGEYQLDTAQLEGHPEEKVIYGATISKPGRYHMVEFKHQKVNGSWEIRFVPGELGGLSALLIKAPPRASQNQRADAVNAMHNLVRNGVNTRDLPHLKQTHVDALVRLASMVKIEPFGLKKVV